MQAGRSHTKDKAEPAEATRSKLKRMLALKRRFLKPVNVKRLVPRGATRTQGNQGIKETKASKSLSFTMAMWVMPKCRLTPKSETEEYVVHHGGR